ncbi:terminase large subunit [Vagococcus carniphilus]|uniref:terminase large subunit n=1 Tax=Vagococcus carniphilus TaxID=218144 RepID=UPI0028928470|nr:terminase TerL endonuclease subunit [Vagococcus carniphilus]MDT2850170.1 terminase large subunit [Vagococcus carniphilus]
MIEKGVNYADEYAKRVRKKPKEYPKTIRDAVDRYYRWKKRKDIWFDVDKANEAMDFMESFIRHVNGDLAGQLLKLESWQKFGYSQLYGWQRINEKGEAVRVIREVYWQVPKKNGKTLIAVGGLAYAMYGEGKLGVNTFCCASDYTQAQYAAKPYAAAIINSEPLYDVSKIYKGKKDTIEAIVYKFTIDNITFENDFKVMTKETDKIEGSNPYFVLNDECHVQKNMNQYDNFKSAMINRDEPIMFNISTAGRGTSSVGMRIYKEAKETLKKDDDDTRLVLIYEPNKGYEWDDRDVWKMVNPNIGVSVTMEALEMAFKNAKKSNFSKGEFLAKHLNLFVNSNESYFDLDQVEKCLIETTEENQEILKEFNDSLEGEMCWLGLDLSKTTDLTSATLNFPSHDEYGNPLLKLKQRYWIPSDNLDAREKEDNVPYSELVEQGHVELCDGKMINEDMIVESIKEWMNVYDIQKVNYDPAMSATLIPKIENLGLECTAVGQYPNVVNAPITDAELLIYQEQIRTDNPLFVYCASNVVITKNLGGMKAASKSKSVKKIDGFISFIIAHKETMFEMEHFDDDELEEYLESIYR